MRAKHWRVLVAMGLGLSACMPAGQGGSSPQPNVSPTGIIVASFNFPESEILAEIYGQALVGGGFPVTWAHGIGPRELVEPALEKGLVGLVPEYQGSALAFLEGPSAATADVMETHKRLVQALASRGVTALDPAPAQDANGIAVTSATARRLGLESVSDLLSPAPELVFGGPPECPTRPLCLVGLKQRYGLSFKRFVAFDPGRPLAAVALSEGLVDVALLFTTDQEIIARDLVLLRDDRGLQPAENVTPMLSSSIVRYYGDHLVALINRVSAALTTFDVASLNLAVSTGSQTSAQAAREWLVRKGLVN
jgi:osmoprotectant transport system substrate-binding protein